MAYFQPLLFKPHEEKTSCGFFHFGRVLERTWLIDCFFLALLAMLAYSCYGLVPLFTPDEGRYAEIPREMLALKDFITPHLNYVLYFEKPPLIYWICSGLMHIFGQGLAVVRFVNPLLSSIGILVLYAIARKVFNRYVALLCACITLSSLWYMVFGRLLTLDCGLSFFLSMSLLFFIKSVQIHKTNPETKYLLMAYLFSGFAVMTKGLVGLVFPIMIIGLWVVVMGYWQMIIRLRMVLGLVLVALISLPWALMVEHRHPGFMHFYFIEQQFLRFSTPIASRHMDKSIYITSFVFGFSPWFVFLFQAIKRAFGLLKDKHAHRLEIFALIWGVVIVVFFGFSHSILLTYLLPTIMPFAILIALYLNDRGEKPWALDLSAAVFALFIFAIVLCIALIYVYGQETLFYKTKWSSGLFYVNALVLLAYAGSLIHVWRLKSLHRFIIVNVFMMVVFANTLWLTAPFVTQKSILPLVPAAQKILDKHPDFKVVSYQDYLQDLPFYLKRRVVVVGDVGELAYGLAHQEDAKDWLMSNQTFMASLASGMHYIVFAKYPAYNSTDFLKQNFDLVQQANQFVLLKPKKD